jgi:hypothetical protein
LISAEDQSTSYFLGHVAISDPSDFIAAESQRIPFKTSLSKPHEWQDAFTNWPLPPIVGWRNWYKRMLDNDSPKTNNWDSLRIAHCLELSLAETPKNESLLIAASHQRSETSESNLLFSSLSLDFDCNLVIHLALISASICYRRTSLVLKKSLSTSSSIPQLKKKTPRTSRRPTISCAVAFDI